MKNPPTVVAHLCAFAACSVFLMGCNKQDTVIRNVTAQVWLERGWNASNDVHVEEANLTTGYIRFTWNDSTFISHGPFTLLIRK